MCAPPLASFSRRVPIRRGGGHRVFVAIVDGSFVSSTGRTVKIRRRFEPVVAWARGPATMAAVGPDDPFDDVLLAARAGAEWAWTRLYEALAPKVVGYMRAHGAADPEDLAGEVFLQAVGGLAGFIGGEREFRAWLFTIAHRRLVDDLRRRRRRPADASSADVVEHAAGAGGDVAREAEARMSDAALRAAIDELPTDQRTVMLLRIIGDLTIEEIARAVGKRPGAVKALQRRALIRLERAYPFDASER